jgi:acetoin utilization deacetylase AcuC-like enzyme
LAAGPLGLVAWRRLLCQTEPMRTTGLVVDSRFRRHVTGPHHPESVQRLAAIDGLLDDPPYRELPRIPARPADDGELRRVHSRSHVDLVAASAERDHTQFDADTPASAGSFEAAKLAAGGSIELADAIWKGVVDNGFAAVRPPGHHAEADRPMGFCLFNNVAIVARHLLAARGLERVLILDWDVHHGNGTQFSFYDEAAVLYVSLHQYPFYPGTGASGEIGRGNGAGYTVNLPMPSGAGDRDYLAAFRDVVVPIARGFDPQFVLISAGFDAHRDDPLASIELHTEAFADFTDAMVGVADDCCDGKVMALLEGGYNLEALRASVAAMLGRLGEPRSFDDRGAELHPWSRRTIEAVAPYWKI